MVLPQNGTLVAYLWHQVTLEVMPSGSGLTSMAEVTSLQQGTVEDWPALSCSAAQWGF